MITRGWRRLFIVLSIVWLVASISWAAVEHYSINFFEQFDSTPQTHLFWQWSLPITSSQPLATEVENGRIVFPRNLTIKPVITSLIILTPIMLLWLFAWCFVWVKQGFKQ